MCIAGVLFLVGVNRRLFTIVGQILLNIVQFIRFTELWNLENGIGVIGKEGRGRSQFRHHRIRERSEWNRRKRWERGHRRKRSGGNRRKGNGGERNTRKRRLKGCSGD